MKIVGVSDVSIGFGSPQIPALMNSLTEHYGIENPVLIEPDQPERDPKHYLFPNLQIKRIPTIFHPYGEFGRVEYIVQAATEVNRVRPNLLVICGSFCLPLLFKLHFRPQCVIYYVLETASHYGPFDIEMNHQARTLMNLAIYPEEHRALTQIDTYGYEQIPNLVLYNCANPSKDGHAIPARKRNGRILYQGTIEEGRTYAEYFLNPAIGPTLVDLYGLIEGPNRKETLERFTKLVGTVRYCGYLDSPTLTQVRKEYCYSIVMWNPNKENQLYACPNKFFESIADGVPPISAPHPQMKMLIERYKCGILMDDWSFSSFRAAVRKAMKTWRTPAYAQMVENCKRATAEELNWDAQFEKVKPFLPARV